MGFVCTMNNFMKYPNFALKIGCISPFEWKNQPNGTTSLNTHRKIFTKIWCCFGVVNLIYQIIGMIVYLFDAILEDNSVYENLNTNLVTVISETGAVLALVIVATCKMYMILRQRKKISGLLENFQEIFPENDFGAYRVEYFAKTSHLMMKRTTIFFLSAWTSYNLFPIAEIIYELMKSDREVLYRYQSFTRYPWQYASYSLPKISFLASYICQMQSSLTGVSFIMAGEFMLCFFITQMQLHFDYLSNMLRSLDRETGLGAFTQLRSVIRYHNKLLEYGVEINKIFNVSFLVNFVTSSVAICLMCFSMVMISPAHALKYSMGLLSFLVFTFFICYVGNEYTSACEKLPPAALYSSWYNNDVVYRKMLIIFMIRANKPCVLRAYKFTTVSIHTFMIILKTSYQLFTFIQAMG